MSENGCRRCGGWLYYESVIHERSWHMHGMIECLDCGETVAWVDAFGQEHEIPLRVPTPETTCVGLPTKSCKRSPTARASDGRCRWCRQALAQERAVATSLG